MKKIRTYGKRSRREIFIRQDKFSEIIDGSFARSPSNPGVKAVSGWCQPKKFDDLSADLFTHSFGAETLSPQKPSLLRSPSCESVEEYSDVRDAGQNFMSSTPYTARTFAQNGSTLQFENCSAKSTPVSSKICRSQLSFLEALTPYRLARTKEATDTKLKPLVLAEHQCTAEEKVLALCGQQSVISINDYLKNKLVVKKIGEGLYGEVYEVVSEDEHLAIKIVPVEGELKVNGQTQKSFKEMLSEIAISKELSALNDKIGIQDENGNQAPSFIRVHRTVCCYGCYPEDLLGAWIDWDDEQQSENDNPSILSEGQIFIIFETELGGKSLEDWEPMNVAKAKSILHQVTAALAVGEKAMMFEHRDLHWGNLLIRDSATSSLQFCIENRYEDIATAGMQVDIIDFTLSRLDKDGCVVFCNLEDDDELFQGSGDYQFEIYRMMQEANNNQWKDFYPKTNVMWIHYLTEKIITTKLKWHSKKLSNFYQRILLYDSAFALLDDKLFG